MGLFKARKIAMVTPTKDRIYAPSRIETKITEMDMQDFIANYADSARGVQVSREADGKSKPQATTAYANGLMAWFVQATAGDIAAAKAPKATTETGKVGRWFYKNET